MPKVPFTVHWTRFESPHGRMHVAATERGVCYLQLPADAEEQFFGWLRKNFRAEDIVEDPLGAKTGDAIQQLTDYFAGARETFDLPLHFVGTDFQQAVWRALLQIPRGGSRTYGEGARSAGRPGAFQATGGAVGSNPLPIVVPCHRVLGSDGSLTGYGGGLPMKELLLKLEGATYKPNNLAQERGPVIAPAKLAVRGTPSRESSDDSRVRGPTFPARGGLLGKIRGLFA
jgi:O-6-methylguanine DNA methyltransferase